MYERRDRFAAGHEEPEPRSILIVVDHEADPVVEKVLGIPQGGYVVR